MLDNAMREIFNAPITSIGDENADDWLGNNRCIFLESANGKIRFGNIADAYNTIKQLEEEGYELNSLLSSFVDNYEELFLNKTVEFRIPTSIVYADAPKKLNVILPKECNGNFTFTVPQEPVYDRLVAIGGGTGGGSCHKKLFEKVELLCVRDQNVVRNGIEEACQNEYQHLVTKTKKDDGILDKAKQYAEFKRNSKKKLGQLFTLDDNNSETFQQVIDRSNHEHFSDSPFKLIRDYLAADRFLADYAPSYADYAADLLGFRLSYTIAQEKVIAYSALRNLAKEIDSFCSQHPDSVTIACKVIDLDNPVLYLALPEKTLRLHYEPDLNPIDWENRYKDLRRRHGQA